MLAPFFGTFLPFTFIAGVFGMNFRNFPELDWPCGLQGAIVLMVLVGVEMYLFFRHKKGL